MAGTGDNGGLRGVQAVYLRPELYFGEIPHGGGLHALVRELIDRASGGTCRWLRCTLAPGNRVRLQSDAADGLDAVTLPMYRAIAGTPRWWDALALASGGCAELRCEHVRDGVLTTVVTQRGDLAERVTREPVDDPDRLVIELQPDPLLFGPMPLSPVWLGELLRVRAHLRDGMTTVFVDESEEPAREVTVVGDLAAWVEALAGERARVPAKPIVVRAEHVRAALVWVEGAETEIHSYANGWPTSRAGTHVDAFVRALGRSTEGLVAVLAVDVPDAQFDSQKRERLVGEIDDLETSLRAALAPALAGLAGVPGCPSTVAPLISRLETELDAAPEDGAALTVYADALIAAGDPRGEVIAIQRSIADENDPAAIDALDRRGAALLASRRTAIWGRPGGVPFSRAWRGRRFHTLVGETGVTGGYDGVCRFLAEHTDARGPWMIQTLANKLDKALVALGFELSLRFQGVDRWARRAPPEQPIHDEIEALGKTGIVLTYLFRFARDGHVLPYQRPGWYAHGLGLSSLVRLARAESYVHCHWQLPFADLRDLDYEAIRLGVGVHFGETALGMFQR